MIGGMGFQEIAIILVILIVLFGPKRLPSIGKSIGEAIREFKGAGKELMKTHGEEENNGEVPQKASGD